MTDYVEPKIADLEASAARGDASAQVELGRRYFYGKDVIADQHKAAILFQQAADQGSMDGRVGIALCHSTGRGLARDDRKADQILEEAAQQGNAWALYLIGKRQVRKGGNDTKLGILTLEKVIKSESAPVNIRIEAATHLAYCYNVGKQVAKDTKKSIDYYSQAADLGDPLSKAAVAEYLWAGKEIPQDRKKAFQLFSESAHNGCALAAKALGNKLEWGDGMPASFAQAADMYQLAARSGSAVAPHLYLGLAAARPAQIRLQNVSDNLYDELNIPKLKVGDLYSIAHTADLTNDEDHALQYYAKCASKEALASLTPSVRRQIQRVNYFRKRAKSFSKQAADDYFWVLASTESLFRHGDSKLKVHIPLGADGYSNELRKIIIGCFEQWLEASKHSLTIEEVSDAASATLRFIPVDKDIFYGFSAARTCYHGRNAKYLLGAGSKSAIQLPHPQTLSDDDKVNFTHTCLHEIGHALGITAHSVFGGDVMFGTRSHLDKLSERDVKAIHALYAENAEERISAILEREIIANNPYALGRMGLYHYSHMRFTDGIALLERASELGNEQAQISLGLHCWTRLNFKKAQTLFEKAAAAGSTDADLYRRWLLGLRGKTDKITLDSLKTAAAHGNAGALVTLGMFYTFGDDDHPKDVTKGAALIQQAVDQGFTFATLALAANKVVATADKLTGSRK